MDYNFWDDRTHELEINPCKGCEDYQDGKCILEEKRKFSYNYLKSSLDIKWTN